MSDQNMKKRNFALIAGILAIGLVAATIVGGQSMTAVAQEQEQEQTRNTDKRPIVSTTGSASVKVEPDKVSVNIGVETRSNTTAADAVSANAELMEEVLAALRALGVEDNQIATSNFSVFPIYGNAEPDRACIMIYPPPPECLTKTEVIGYSAVNTVTVTLDATADVGEIIDSAVEAGANNVSGAYFFISPEKQEEVRNGLIEGAIANAKSRADRAAEAVDMEVVGVKSISLNDVHFPVFFRELAADAASSTPILPGEQQVTMTVQVVYTMG